MAVHQIRQGDVLLVPVKAKPGELRQEAPAAGRLVIAQGEATGHAHTVDAAAATVWVGDEEERFLEVMRECALTHEEHSPLALAPGVYRIVHQREYSPGEIRWVAD